MSEGPAFNFLLRLAKILYGAAMSAKCGMNLPSEPFKRKNYFLGGLIAFPHLFYLCWKPKKFIQ